MATKKKKEIDVTSQYIPAFSIKDIKFTDKQRELIRIIRDENTKMVFITGPAGTSKTFCATFSGLLGLRDKSKGKFKFLRALVENTNQKCGFLPGSLEEKTSVYAQPILDKLFELLSPYDAKKLLDEKTIECLCPNFLRGVTWSNEYILCDECQNIDWRTLVTILTRLGEGSTLILAGDEMQSDIGGDGFSKMVRLFDTEESRNNGIYCFEFTSDDVMRSGILKYILHVLEKRA